MQLNGAYVIADNRLAELAGWDKEILAIELQGLIELDFAVDTIGFETAEIDLILDEAREADPATPTGPEDDEPAPPQTPITRPVLGRHRGDALEPATYAALTGDELAAVIFTDPTTCRSTASSAAKAS